MEDGSRRKRFCLARNYTELTIASARFLASSSSFMNAAVPNLTSNTSAETFSAAFFDTMDATRRNEHYSSVAERAFADVLCESFESTYLGQRWKKQKSAEFQGGAQTQVAVTSWPSHDRMSQLHAV